MLILLLPTILKKLLQIIILILITSCGSTKNTPDRIADEKFELCSEFRYKNQSTKFGRIPINSIVEKNIHNSLENYLIQDGYLREISKKGYSELLNKAIRKEIDAEFFVKFKTDIEFDPLFLFPLNYHAGCYDYL